jgi:hypothetical protein
MKNKIRITSRLKLNKDTITKLQDKQMEQVMGGAKNHNSCLFNSCNSQITETEQLKA